MKNRIGCALLAAAVLTAGCATQPTPPADPLLTQLDAGERIALRIPARLLHGHDMEEPSYDAPEGYRPIPTFQGELAVTDQRLLFVQKPAANDTAWLSIPYVAISRSRPSQTALLNYLVIWDARGHPDSFVVDSADVGKLHQAFARAMSGHASNSPQMRRFPDDR